MVCDSHLLLKRRKQRKKKKKMGTRFVVVGAFEKETGGSCEISCDHPELCHWRKSCCRACKYVFPLKEEEEEEMEMVGE